MAIATTPNYTLYHSWPLSSMHLLSPYPLKPKPEKVHYNHQPPEWWLCENAPWKNVEMRQRKFSACDLDRALAILCGWLMYCFGADRIMYRDCTYYLWQEP